jgi:hypothetical protein
LLDTFAMAAMEPAQTTAQHYSQCIRRSRLTTRQIANYLREYGGARPEMQSDMRGWTVAKTSILRAKSL